MQILIWISDSLQYIYSWFSDLPWYMHLNYGLVFFVLTVLVLKRKEIRHRRKKRDFMIWDYLVPTKYRSKKKYYQRVWGDLLFVIICSGFLWLLIWIVTTP